MSGGLPYHHVLRGVVLVVDGFLVVRGGVELIVGRVVVLNQLHQHARRNGEPYSRRCTSGIRREEKEREGY